MPLIYIRGDAYNPVAICAILQFEDGRNSNFQVVLYGAVSDDYIMYDGFSDAHAMREAWKIAVESWQKGLHESTSPGHDA